MKRENYLRVKKEEMLYLLFFFVFFIFQTKVLNTGDAGELISASYGLGIAHPSGYPLYLMASKLFTFLPFGNIPTKVALVSSMSSTVLLIFITKFLKRIGVNFLSALFASFMLISSYSFFCQSVIAKFYPLNTLLIFIIFWLGYESLHEYKLTHQLLISFLLGLAAGLHHTTYLMVIPLLVLIVFHFKRFVKHLPYSITFFVFGFSVVLYLLVRSWKPVLVNLSPSPNFHTLFYTLLRKVYGSGSSINVASSLFYPDYFRIFYSVRNFFELLLKEFFYYSIVFFLVGLAFLWKKGKRAFLYIIASFLSYSFLLAYLTFSIRKPTILNWYIIGNQYYLPAFVFYVLICGIGFFYISRLVPVKVRKFYYFLMLLPLIYFPQNFFLNFYNNNSVAYYVALDQLFIKPIRSVVVFTGDNDVFSGWYEKNIEKFRDDLCILTAPTITSKEWRLVGCNGLIYKGLFPYVFNLKLGTMNIKRIALENGGYLFSSSPFIKNSDFRRYFKSYFASLNFYNVLSEKNEKIKVEKFLEEYRRLSLPYLHFDYCLNYGTDDFFSKLLCEKYTMYLLYLSRDLGRISSSISLKVSSTISKIRQVKINAELDNMTYNINIKVSPSNMMFLKKAFRINKYNNLDTYYLFNGALK